MADREYTRLTWARRNPKPALLSTASSSLWLGKDHLLVVESNGYTERYRRFYFKDIQALIICKTKTGLIRAIILGALGLFFGLLAVALRDEPVALYFMGGMALLLVVSAVADALYGPTALCSLRTAVQTEELPSLKRIRRAREVLEVLKPLLTAAQGTLSPEEVAAQVQTRPAPAEPATHTPPAAVGEIPPRILP